MQNLVNFRFTNILDFRLSHWSGAALRRLKGTLEKSKGRIINMHGISMELIQSGNWTKTGLDLDLDDPIYELKRVTQSGQQGIKTGRSFLTVHRSLVNPAPTGIRTPQNTLGQCWVPPYHHLLCSDIQTHN